MTILYLGALRNILLDHQVKAKDIDISSDEQSGLVTVAVKNNKGSKYVSGSKDQIVNNPMSFVCYLTDLALWYHGGHIPQSESFAEWLSRNVANLLGVTNDQNRMRR